MRAKSQTIIPIPILTTAIIRIVESFSATEEEMEPRLIANMLAAIEKKQGYQSKSPGRMLGLY